MSKSIGRLMVVGVGKESVRGTPVAPTYWLPCLDMAIDTKEKHVMNDQSLGRIEGVDGMTIVSQNGEMTFKSKIKDKSLGLLLLATFGSVSSAAKAGGNSSVYDHTFSVAQNVQHPSLTFAEVGVSNLAYGLGMIDSLSFDVDPKGYPTVEFKVLSKPGASAANTVSVISERDFLAKHLTFKMATTQSGLAGANAVSVRNLKMEIKKNLMLEEVLGSTAPNDILNQNFEIKGSVTVVHNGLTNYNLQANETEQALRFDCVPRD